MPTQCIYNAYNLLVQFLYYALYNACELLITRIYMQIECQYSADRTQVKSTNCVANYQSHPGALCDFPRKTLCEWHHKGDLQLYMHIKCISHAYNMCVTCLLRSFTMHIQCVQHSCKMPILCIIQCL